jgi:hypothetical protein
VTDRQSRRTAKRSVVFVAVVLALLTATGVTSAGCGGGGRDADVAPGTPQTLEEYFRQLDAADNVASARLRQIASQLSTRQPETEALATIKEVFPEEVVTLEDLLGSMEKLRPPADIRTQHEAAVSALRRSVDVAKKNAAAIEKATAFNQVSDLLNGQASTDANEKTSATCSALEQAGTERGISVDLDC